MTTVLINDNFLRLLIWTIADGSFHSNKYNSKYIRFGISKERKINSLTELLNSLNIQYSHNISTKLRGVQKNFEHTFYISTADSQNIYEYLLNKKECPNWFLTLNKDQAKIVFNEYSITDGCWVTDNRNTLEVSSSNYKDIEILKDLNKIHFNCKTWELSRQPTGNFSKNAKVSHMIRFNRLKQEIQ